MSDRAWHATALGCAVALVLLVALFAGCGAIQPTGYTITVEAEGSADGVWTWTGDGLTASEGASGTVAIGLTLHTEAGDFAAAGAITGDEDGGEAEACAFEFGGFCWLDVDRVLWGVPE